MKNAKRNVSPIFGNNPPKSINEIPVSVIIPAAGMGRRMKSYGSKSLIKIKDDLLIEYQIKSIKKYIPNSDIVLITGFESSRVADRVPQEVIIVENERYDETNIVKSIGMGLRASRYENVLIIHGDLVWQEELLNNMQFDKSFLMVDTSNTMGEEEVGLTINGPYVENALWSLPNKWCQISFFTGKELKILSNLAWDKSKEKWFLFEVINEIIRKGGKMIARKSNGAAVLDIDTSKDIERAISIL